MLPEIFSTNLFDDFFDDSFAMTRHNPLYGRHAANIMKTDVRETENSYELDIDLPGFKKEDVSVQLDNGYLTISAAKSLDKDEKNKEGKYIRQERYTGQCSRSFYVGDNIESKDVGAKFEDGILKLTMPKNVPQVQHNNYIAIE